MNLQTGSDAGVATIVHTNFIVQKILLLGLSYLPSSDNHRNAVVRNINFTIEENIRLTALQLTPLDHRRFHPTDKMKLNSENFKIFHFPRHLYCHVPPPASTNNFHPMSNIKFSIRLI